MKRSSTNLTTFIAITMVTTLAAGSGCKDKANNAAPPQGAGTGATPGSAAVPNNPGSAEPAGSGSAQAPAAPRAPGKFSPTEIVDISRIKLEGYDSSPMSVTDSRTTVRHYQDRKGQRLATFITATINPCQECTPMDLAEWQKKAEIIKTVTLDEKIRKSAKFELGTAEIGGKKIISGYQLGQSSEGEITYTNAVSLWYNDGVNEIWVMAQYGDNPVKDAETMASLVPRAQLEDQAAAAMAEYLKKF